MTWDELRELQLQIFCLNAVICLIYAAPRKRSEANQPSILHRDKAANVKP